LSSRTRLPTKPSQSTRLSDCARLAAIGVAILAAAGGTVHGQPLFFGATFALLRLAARG
jgi:hypothetical protein